MGRAEVSAVFVLMGAGAVAQAGFNLLTARLLGVERAGYYFIGLALLTILGFASRLGVDQLVIRFASPMFTSEDVPAIRGVVAVSARVVLGATLIVGSGGLLVVVTIAALGWVPEHGAAEMGMAMATLVPFNFALVGAGLLRALDRAAEAISYRFVGIFLPATAMLGVQLLFVETPLGFVSLFVASSLSAALLWARLHTLIGPGPTVPFPRRRLLDSALPLGASTMLNALSSWADILIVGAVAGASLAGPYGAAWQIVAPFNLLLLVGGTVGSPSFARLYEANDLVRLEEVVRRQAGYLLLGSLLIAVPLVMLRDVVLEILGEGFEVASTAALILVVAQIVNTGAGSVGNLFVMAGKERPLLTTYAAFAVISLAGVAALTPRWGVTGAAVAAGFGLAGRNLVLIRLAKREIGVSAGPMLPGRIGPRHA